LTSKFKPPFAYIVFTYVMQPEPMHYATLTVYRNCTWLYQQWGIERAFSTAGLNQSINQYIFRVA